MIRLLNHRKVITFQLQGACKTPGGIYTSYKGVYEFFDCMPVWFADIGKDCQILKEGADIGDIGIMNDAFELEEIPNYWQDYEHLPQFQLLRKKAEEIDAEITASFVHENSLIAWFRPAVDGTGGQQIVIGRGETGKFYS